MFRAITVGFVASGLMNFSVLLFTRGFTSPTLSEVHPTVCSNFGMVVVIVWGLAYLAVAKKPPAALALVFAIEKAVYVASWLMWMQAHRGELPAIWDRDPLAAIFLAIYGINDLIFGTFFAWCWWQSRKLQTTHFSV